MAVNRKALLGVTSDQSQVVGVKLKFQQLKLDDSSTHHLPYSEMGITCVNSVNDYVESQNFEGGMTYNRPFSGLVFLST